MDNNYYRTFWGLLVLMALPACQFFSEKHDENTFIVGTSPDYPPFESLNKDGNPEGLDIDLAEAVAQRLGKKLVVYALTFDALILALHQKKIDAIFSALSITEPRRREIHLIHYHGKSLAMLPVLFYKKVPMLFHSLEDFKNIPDCIVTVQAGTIYQEIMSHYPDVQIKPLDTVANMIIDLTYGKSCAAVVEPGVAEMLIAQEPLLQVVYAPLRPDEIDFGHGIGIKKERTDLAQKIENIIEHLKQDGTLQKIEDRWFGGVTHDKQ